MVSQLVLLCCEALPGLPACCHSISKPGCGPLGSNTSPGLEGRGFSDFSEGFVLRLLLLPAPRLHLRQWKGKELCSSSPLLMPFLLSSLALASPSSRPRMLPTSPLMLRALLQGVLMSHSSRSIALPRLLWLDTPLTSARCMGASCTTLALTQIAVNPALVSVPFAFPLTPACRLMPDARSSPSSLSWGAHSLWHMARARLPRCATGTTFMGSLGHMAMPPEQLRLTLSFRPSSVIKD